MCRLVTKKAINKSPKSVYKQTEIIYLDLISKHDELNRFDLMSRVLPSHSYNYNYNVLNIQYAKQ